MTPSDIACPHPGDIVHAARNGDRGAVEDLIHMHSRLVWWTVRSFRLGEADAHDAVQNTWLRMIEHLGELRDADRLSGWLVTVARRECIKLQKRGRREVPCIEPMDSGAIDDDAPRPEQVALERSMGELLWSHVAQLPSAGRDVIITLAATDRPRYADFARRNGIPIGSIGPTRMRMLRKLRRRLEECGLGRNAW